MAVTVKSVDKNSKCAKMGVSAGDELLKIDGNEIMDVLDYDFYMSRDRVRLEFKCTNSAYRVFYASPRDCGLNFDTYLMDKQQSCKNKCIFCFIDQLPKGLRPSLYFKDDDSRLSFLFGNYITLTNISEHEINRIISMHISPVNISVHTMNPDLRVKMMKNKNAGKALEIIDRFARAGIEMNTQLVLCPNVNDGDELRYSIEKLSALYPAVKSIACVPVGITKFREGLFPLTPYNAETAGEVIDIIEEYSSAFRKKYGEGLVYPADEFFIKAKRPLPSEDYYDGYPQIENGVGSVRSFCEDFCAELEKATPCNSGKKITMATGVDFYPFLTELAEKASEKLGVQINVKRIINRFFGETITVAGLITGCDLYSQLKDEDLGDRLLLPYEMISDYTSHTEHKNKFLDDMTVEELEKLLNVKIGLTSGASGLIESILEVE